MAPDQGAHLARQIERLGFGEKRHDRLLVNQIANLRPPLRWLKQNRKSDLLARSRRREDPGASGTMC
jgi:hypothetical protein